MIEKIVTSPWFVAAGVSVGLAILAKFVDEDKAYEVGKKRGRQITEMMGKSTLGKKAWEKIEGFLQKIGGAYFHGIMDGLDTDDDPPPSPQQPS